MYAYKFIPSFQVQQQDSTEQAQPPISDAFSSNPMVLAELSEDAVPQGKWASACAYGQPNGWKGKYDIIRLISTRKCKHEGMSLRTNCVCTILVPAQVRRLIHVRLPNSFRPSHCLALFSRFPFLFRFLSPVASYKYLNSGFSHRWDCLYEIFQ